MTKVIVASLIWGVGLKTTSSLVFLNAALTFYYMHLSNSIVARIIEQEPFALNGSGNVLTGIRS